MRAERRWQEIGWVAVFAKFKGGLGSLFLSCLRIVPENCKMCGGESDVIFLYIIPSCYQACRS